MQVVDTATVDLTIGDGTTDSRFDLDLTSGDSLLLGNSAGDTATLNLQGGWFDTYDARATGRAIFNVINPGSYWQSDHVLISGDTTTNTAGIGVGLGAQIETIDDLDVGSDTGSGRAAVDGTQPYTFGPSALWTVTGTVDIGPDSTTGFNFGQVTLYNGGRMNAGGLSVHGTSDVASKMTVQDAGKLDVSGNLNIGSYGALELFGTNSKITTGSLSKSGTGGSFNWTGGTLEITGEVVRLDSAAPHSVLGSNLTVGTGKKLIVSTIGPDAESLTVGSTGGGNLTIEGGGDVESYRGTIGAFGTSSGVVTVRNPGSTWTVTEQLRVGQVNSADGELNIQDSAAVSASFVTIGLSENAQGFVTVDGLESTLTSSGDLWVGNNTGGSGTLTVRNSGAATVDGALNVSHFGTVDLQTYGELNANGNVTIDGGALQCSNNASFNLAAGKKLTAKNNGQVGFTGSYELDDGTTFDLQSGADLAIADYLDIGNDTDGTLTVDGAGTTLTTNTTIVATFLDWGLSGGTANVTLKNNAIADIRANVYLVRDEDEDSASTAHVNIQSGADMTMRSLFMAYNTAGTADFTVTGLGSTVTQTGASDLTVGGTGSGSAALTVEEYGEFDTGTGSIVVNPTGTIDVKSNGVLTANGNVTIDGGTLRRSSDASFNLAAGETLTVKNNGQVEFTGYYSLRNGTTFDLQSGADLLVTNYLDIGSGGNGTLTVDGAGTTLTTNTTSYTYLDWGTGGTANITLKNNAVADIHSDIILANNGTAHVNVQSGADMTVVSLFLAPYNSGTADFTVTGSGSTVTQIGDGDLTVGSLGSTSATLTVQNDAIFTTGTGDTTVSQTGTIDVREGGIFDARGPIYVNSGGTFALSTGGVLHAEAFHGPLHNLSGTLAPGHHREPGQPFAAGTTTMDGQYVQEAAAALEIELGGAASDQYDRLVLTNTATLGGWLNVLLANSFAPSGGDTFHVIEGPTSGAFAHVSMPTLSGGLALGWKNDLANQRLTIMATLYGDANLDGSVNLSDLGFLGDNYGTTSGATWAMGDFNYDGQVNLSDLGFLGDQYGGHITGFVPTGPVGRAAPEPGTLVLLAMASVGLGFYVAGKRGSGVFSVDRLGGK